MQRANGWHACRRRAEEGTPLDAGPRAPGGCRCRRSPACSPSSPAPAPGQQHWPAPETRPGLQLNGLMFQAAWHSFCCDLALPSNLDNFTLLDIFGPPREATWYDDPAVHVGKTVQDKPGQMSDSV